MTSKALLWLAALAIAGGIVVPWLWWAASPEAPAHEPPPFVELPRVPATAPTPLAPSEPAPVRSRAAAAAPDRRDQPRAFAEESVWTLDVLVLDPDDQPLAGARVLLAPIELSLNTVGWTDARGRLSIELAAPLDTQRVVLAGEHERYGRSALRVLELSPRPWHLAVELRPSPDAPRFAVEEAGALFEPRAAPPWSSPLETNVERDEAPELAGIDRDGRVRFAQRLEDLPGEPLDAPNGWSAPTPPPDPSRTLASSIPWSGESAVFVKGIVRDARGARVAGARVHAFDPDRGLDYSLRSFHDGSFGLGPIPARGMHLSIGGGDLGRYESELSGSPERFQHVNAALQRGRELGGVLRDESGLPLAGWRIEAVDSTGTNAWADVAWSDALGRFALPNAPSTMLRIDVFAPGADAFPVWSERGLWAEPDLAIAVPARVLAPGSSNGESQPLSGSLRIEAIDGDGATLDDAALVLESESAGRAAILAFDASANAYVARGLQAGRYRLRAHHRGDRSIVRPEPIDMTAGAQLDLGRIAFEKRGVVGVEVDPTLGDVDYALEIQNGAWPIHLGAFRVRGRWATRLAPGLYVLRARFANGEESTFELDVDGHHARVLRISAAAAR